MTISTSERPDPDNAGTDASRDSAPPAAASPRSAATDSDSTSQAAEETTDPAAEDASTTDSEPLATASSPVAEPARPREIGGQVGPEPTRYGDWEKKGRCTDF